MEQEGLNNMGNRKVASSRFLGCLVFLSALSIFTSVSCTSVNETGVSGNEASEDESVKLPDSAYRIQSGDIVLIDVWRVQVLSQKVKIGMDGTFVYPLIGTVPAQGKTVDELRAYLTKALTDGYLVDPVVTVTIDTKTQRFFVVGEVKQPGAFTLEEKIDVHQAIITAGGFTDFASRSVKIIRKRGSEKKVIGININHFTEQGKTDREADIQAGDTVVVRKKLI